MLEFASLFNKKRKNKPITLTIVCRNVRECLDTCYLSTEIRIIVRKSIP